MAFLTEVGINILVELELSLCLVATLLKKKSCYPHLSTFTAVIRLCTGMSAILRRGWKFWGTSCAGNKQSTAFPPFTGVAMQGPLPLDFTLLHFHLASIISWILHILTFCPWGKRVDTFDTLTQPQVFCYFYENLNWPIWIVRCKEQGKNLAVWTEVLLFTKNNNKKTQIFCFSGWSTRDLILLSFKICSGYVLKIIITAFLRREICIPYILTSKVNLFMRLLLCIAVFFRLHCCTLGCLSKEC